MSAGIYIALYLIQSLSTIFTTLVILRLLLQLAKADFYNPICQAIIKLTNKPLVPLRRLIPSLWGIDTAALVLSLLVQIVSISAIMFIANGQVELTNSIAWSAINLLSLVTKLYYWLLIFSIILSFAMAFGWNPPPTALGVINVIMQLAEPILAPVRKLLPPISGLDFSPMLVFMAIHVLQIIIRELVVSTGMPSFISLL